MQPEVAEVTATLEQATAARDEAQTTVNRLFNRKGELDGMLAEISDQIRAGQHARIVNPLIVLIWANSPFSVLNVVQSNISVKH